MTRWFSAVSTVRTAPRSLIAWGEESHKRAARASAGAWMKARRSSAVIGVGSRHMWRGRTLASLDLPGGQRLSVACGMRQAAVVAAVTGGDGLGELVPEEDLQRSAALELA